MRNVAKIFSYAVATIALTLILLLVAEEILSFLHAAKRLPNAPSTIFIVFAFVRQSPILLLFAIIAFLPFPWSRKRFWYSYAASVLMLWIASGALGLWIRNTCQGEGCMTLIVIPMLLIVALILPPVCFAIGYVLDRFYNYAWKPLLIFCGVCTVLVLASVALNRFCLRGDGACLGKRLAQINSYASHCAETADVRRCFTAYSQTRQDPQACSSMMDALKQRCGELKTTSNGGTDCEDSVKWDCLSNFGKRWADLTVCKQFPRGPGIYTDTNCCSYVTPTQFNRNYAYVFTTEERLQCGLEP